MKFFKVFRLIGFRKRDRGMDPRRIKRDYRPDLSRNYGGLSNAEFNNRRAERNFRQRFPDGT